MFFSLQLFIIFLSAWSMESGEHMPNKKKFVEELFRVTAPGGRIIIVTWCHRWVLQKIGEEDIEMDEHNHLSTIYSFCYSTTSSLTHTLPHSLIESRADILLLAPSKFFSFNRLSTSPSPTTSPPPSPSTSPPPSASQSPSTSPPPSPSLSSAES